MQDKAILIQVKRGYLEKILLQDIIYVEADSCYSMVYTMKQNYFITKPLKEIERVLEEHNFCRINRGILINLYHLNCIKNGHAIMTTSISFKIPRRNINSIFSSLNSKLLI